MREILRAAAVPVPRFALVSTGADPTAAARRAEYPSVLKPLFLAGSRGVIRANDEAEFVAAFRRIAAMASARGVSICPHAFHHVHVHLVGSVPNTRYVEYFTDNEVVNFPELVDWQPEVVDGEMLLPERPGFGYRFLDEVVERHQLDPWG
jgi:biotin carboxylase